MNTNAPQPDRTLPWAHLRHVVRIGLASAAATAAGIGLSALMYGVSSGADLETPNAPSTIPSIDDSHRSYARIPDDRCLFDPRYLPHTPDAVEGWYHNCLARG